MVTGACDISGVRPFFSPFFLPNPSSPSPPFLLPSIQQISTSKASSVATTSVGTKPPKGSNVATSSASARASVSTTNSAANGGVRVGIGQVVGMFAMLAVTLFRAGL